jgi:serine/threonine protein phosphatase PrpC
MQENQGNLENDSGADKSLPPGDDSERVVKTVVKLRSPQTDFSEKLGDKLAVRSFVGSEKSRNEDYGTVCQETVDGVRHYIIVISDGVSTAEQGHVAAERACQTGRDEIVVALRSNERDMEKCLRRGIEAAQKAVLGVRSVGEEMPWGATKSPPAATFLAAIVTEGIIHLLNLGDCRAYSATADGTTTLLTKDHSWVNQVVDAGTMTLSDALSSPQAHNITGYLGPTGRSAKNFQPTYSAVPIGSATLLVVCSDGFWNYAHPRQDAPAEPFEAELRFLSNDKSALAIADHLVQFADTTGGHDNITVAVLKL